MPSSGIVAEKMAILERLRAAKQRRDKGEARRRLSELQYFLLAEDDARLKETRLDWLDQHRVVHRHPLGIMPPHIPCRKCHSRHALRLACRRLH